MANRVKEDEKNERIIRGLLKLPANRKCINCNSLGPQYVCTNFSIFICTNCSGIHREFTHRVKSVSMAKFTSQEVSNLQEGGNERAREIFFKEWDAQRNSFPDSSNVEKLRTFIKHVYVDRRFTGEKPVDKPPRGKNDREEYDQRRSDVLRSGSRSPAYDDKYDRSGSGGRNDDRNFRYSYDGGRSPGYDQGNYRRSPSHFEVVDDRRRDDKSGISNQNRRFDDRKFPDGVQRSEESSPNHQKSTGSSPVVRPVRDILGGSSPALEVGEPPKSNGARVIEGPPTAQVTQASNNPVSAAAVPSEQKTTATVSLIDFTADPEPSVSKAPEQAAAPQTNLPASEANWASFDTGTVPQVTQNTENLNSLESVLSQLSGSVSSTTTALPLPQNVGADSSAMTTVMQMPNIQQQNPSLFPQSINHSNVQNPSFPQPINQSNVQSFAPSLAGGPSDQLGVPSVATSVPTAHSVFTAQAPQSFPAPKIEPNAPVSSVPNLEAKPSGRKELPADLFTFSYPATHPSMMGWHGRPNYGMVLPVQYPPQVAVAPSFSYSSKSANPFDVSSETTLAHAATFPSLASLQGALPNPVNSSDVMRSASFGSTPFSQMMPQNQPHHPLAAVSGGYTGQQFQTNFPGQQFQGNMPQHMPNMLPMGNQGIGTYPNQMASFGSTPGLNTGFSQTSMVNAFRPTGSSNPFG